MGLKRVMNQPSRQKRVELKWLKGGENVVGDCMVICSPSTSKDQLAFALLYRRVMVLAVSIELRARA